MSMIKPSLLTYLKEHDKQYKQYKEGIVIYEQQIPYLFIPVTNETFDITRFTELHNRYKAPYVALDKDGVPTIYNYFFGHGIYFTDISNIEAFLDIHYLDLFEYDICHRVYDYDIITDDAITSSFITGGIISETSEEIWQQRYSELANALFYERYEPTARELPLTIIDDHGITYLTSGNASGGSYNGIHRRFTAQLPTGNIDFSLSLFATMKTTNDKVYGNRQGATQLNVLMHHSSNAAYNLQINLDKYIEVIGTHYEILHNGIRSRLKKQYVLDTTKEIAPFLVENEYIILGKFPLNDTIAPEDFSMFVENLITYSYCRNMADKRYRK